MFVAKNKISKFIDVINGEAIIALPIMSDSNKHYMNTDISFLYIYTLKSSQEFVLSYNHYDTINNISYSEDLLQNCPEIHVWDSKKFRNLYINDNIIDHGLINYFTNNSQLDVLNYETQSHKFYKNEYWKYGNINNIIPIMKHLESCRLMRKFMINQMDIELDESFS